MKKRLITLFTGQWADMPIEKLLPLVKSMGYDGVELACWGDHFNVQKILESDGYKKKLKQILDDNELSCKAISNHLVGQAVCDHIDERHKGILPNHVWGNGKPEEVRKRAIKEMKHTAMAAASFGVPTVNGFTGSPIWNALYPFPPLDKDYWNRGFEQFAILWGDIMKVFEKYKVNFALEVHPTEIAFDIVSAKRALDALKACGLSKRFGFNYDPSHLGYQGVDYIKFLYEFKNKIYHVHMKDVWWGKGDGSVGVFGGHTSFGDSRRYWDFRSVGRGDINFEEIIITLKNIHYTGPLSVEWEDVYMDREFGAKEALSFLRKLDFPSAQQNFDTPFTEEGKK